MPNEISYLFFPVRVPQCCSWTWTQQTGASPWIPHSVWILAVPSSCQRAHIWHMRCDILEATALRTFGHKFYKCTLKSDKRKSYPINSYFSISFCQDALDYFYGENMLLCSACSAGNNPLINCHPMAFPSLSDWQRTAIAHLPRERCALAWSNLSKNNHIPIATMSAPNGPFPAGQAKITMLSGENVKGMEIDLKCIEPSIPQDWLTKSDNQHQEQEKQKLPLTAVRPWSAYALFFREVQREVKAQREGHLQFGELSKAIARRWEKMGRKEKLVTFEVIFVMLSCKNVVHQMYRERLKELRRAQLRNEASVRALQIARQKWRKMEMSGVWINETFWKWWYYGCFHFPDSWTNKANFQQFFWDYFRLDTPSNEEAK